MRERFIPESEISKNIGSTSTPENRSDSDSPTPKPEKLKTRKSDSEILADQENLIKNLPKVLKKLSNLYEKDSYRASGIASDMFDRILREREKAITIGFKGNKKAKRIEDKLNEISEELLVIMAKPGSKKH